ncbi:hypothetical protein AND_009346 [Anopheles darlingi]|uniref:Uncharacterized protein n=1 Tax=Anopheles darlingi TaxID=43151 RepID=W5J6N7_ANODA|nr:hypothetical protein AND_009346 [Anopheles darlingi]
MERFSINILHQQIYRVCRLCGVDHPEKLPIIEDDDVIVLYDEEDEETSLVKKIEECVGILVHKDDQMPQQICQLCLEKVNDFYEYRLMCAATNVQTRSLLNLHMVHPVVKRVKLELPPRQEEIVPKLDETEDLEEEEEVAELRSTRATKAKPRDEPSALDFNEECKDEDEAVQQKRLKFEHACEYCKDVFTESLGLQKHLVRRHTPRVYPSACYTCCEYFETHRDLKDHESWHKATRTKYHCFRCSKKFVSSKTLKSHIDTKACVRPERSVHPVPLVPDVRCPECRKLFKTRNLFEWHSCFLKARTNCPKCGKFFRQKQPLLRHYIMYCTGTLPVSEPLWETLKSELIESKPDIDIPVALSEKKRGRGRPSGKKSSDQEQFNDEMKVEEEEQCELPYPPPLDVSITVKSEETASAMQTGWHMENPPVASRLRSGTMPHNSSETATTSGDRKNRSRRTRSSTLEDEERTERYTNSTTSENASSPTKQPMVTLSMEAVKQEFLEMNELREQLEDCLSHNETETPNASDKINENTDDAGAPETDHAGDNWQDDGNDHSNDSDDDAGSTPLPETAKISEAVVAGETVASEAIASPLADQEHTVSEKEGVESERNPLPVDIAVKQEPQDDDLMPIVQNPLRITIKKEKGLLNDGEAGGSSKNTSWTIQNSATDDDPLQATVSSKSPKGSSPTKKASKRKEKRSQSSDTHREERSVNKKPRHCTVYVKQEVPDPDPEDEANQNDLPIIEERPVIRIKPEPIDPGYTGRPIKSEFPSASLDDHAYPDHILPSTNHTDGMDADNEPVVAFDGMHIKSERFADGDSLENETNYSSSCGLGEAESRSHRILSNPFSKSNRSKGDESTLRRKTQQGTAKSKLSKMINPFALLKQKATQDQRRASSNLPPVSVPQISEVGSSDPVDQLALDSSPLSTCNVLNEHTHTGGTSDSETEATQKPQSEMIPEFPNQVGAAGENEEISNHSTTDGTKQSDQQYEESENADNVDKTTSTQLLSNAGEIKENLIKSSEESDKTLDQELGNSEQSIDTDESRHNEMSKDMKNTEIPEVAHMSDDKEVERNISPLTENRASNSKIEFRSKMAETYAATPEDEAGSSKQDLARTHSPEDQGYLPLTDSSEMVKTTDSFEPLDASRTGKETVKPLIACTAQADEGSSSDNVKTSAALTGEAKETTHATDILMDGSEMNQFSLEKDIRVVNEVSQELSSLNVEGMKQHDSSIAEKPITMT